jgi:OmpA-OmpF porin, OOP family
MGEYMKAFSHAVSSLLAAIPLALCLLITNASYAQQDKQGCKDSPYISRFPGSILDYCDYHDDDVFKFPMPPGTPDKTIEGKKSVIYYILPAGATSAQVARNVSTALRQAGWINVNKNSDYTLGTWHTNDTWLWVDISGGRLHLTSVTLTNLTQDMVATAAELGTGIGSTGHAVVPGILFDTGKADVKDESKPALEQVAKLLSEHPDWKIWVVGHTDTVGQLAANMDLSKRRAAAVVQALVTQYHIPAARLGSFGCGPYAPVASNDTDAGRTQNRRVEIVKQ